MLLHLESDDDIPQATQEQCNLITIIQVLQNVCVTNPRRDVSSAAAIRPRRSVSNLMAACASAMPESYAIGTMS